MKICTFCEVPKELTCFYRNKRRPDGYQDQCKGCADRSSTISRAKKPELYRDINKSNRDGYRSKFDEWKMLQKCLMCPESNHVCLDLHHLDPATKDVAISNVAHSWTWEKLQTELAKCVVLCRNCHAKVHAGVINLPS